MAVSDGILRLSAPPRLGSPQHQRRRVAAPPARVSWLGRLLRRREPTTYHRCLAIHIHYAGPRSALS